MPRVSHDQKQYYKSRIRSLMVHNPAITQREIQLRLEMEGLRLDRKYLGQLVNGILVERTKRADRATLNYALASFQDAMLEIVQAGWEIVNDPMVRPMQKTLAMREIREAHVAAFEKMFDAGVFERKLGTLDATIRNTPLADDKKRAIADVFAQWKLITPAEKESALPAQPVAQIEAPKEDVTPATGQQP